MNTADALSLVTCRIDMLFPPADADRAVQLLVSSTGRTEAKTGCRSCSVARDANEPNRVCYCETWTEEGAFRRHVRSADFQRVLAAMDMSDEEPQVVVGNLSGRSGISYLEELLGQKDGGAA